MELRGHREEKVQDINSPVVTCDMVMWSGEDARIKFHSWGLRHLSLHNKDKTPPMP